MGSARLFDDYRIGEGGPLRRLEAVCRLTSVHWQIVAVLAVTWVPIMLLGLAGARATGRMEPLLHDAALHVRLLVATPVFLIIDRAFPLLCGRVMVQLSRQAFVGDAARPRFHRTLRRAARLAESSLPEALLVIFSVGFAVAALLGFAPIRGLSARDGLTPAKTWYVLTSLPLFQFLLWRSLWRWAIWVRILAGLSRVDLDLVPIHPDRCGGIAFLRLPSIGYCTLLLFAVSSVLCAEWGGRFPLGSTPESFTPLLLLFAIVGTLVAFGPLLLFAPQLSRARRDGLAEAAELSTWSGRRFRRRCRRGVLDTDQVQGISAMADSYRETLDRMRFLLFDKRDLISLLAATLLPLLPVMLARVPREDWMKVIGLLTGGRLK